MGLKEQWGHRSKDIDNDGVDGLMNNRDLPTATQRLFDALHTYINVSEIVSRDLRSLNVPDTIVPERIDRCRALLREIEQYEVDPTLNEMLNPYGD